MKKVTERKYLTIGDIQREYLPISTKKLRQFVKEHSLTHYIGNRIYVERTALEHLLSQSEDKGDSME
jgi:hypothetical protein